LPERARNRSALRDRERENSSAGDEPALPGQASQTMSWPQHVGDLILPSHLGHFEICTTVPSSVVSVSLTSGSLQSAHVALTPMPQTLQR
jgi:hypothetical protein